MGWKEGKGLGKHENGMQEHVKVGAKCDNKGIKHLFFLFLISKTLFQYYIYTYF